jgi:hypothetical protein
LLLGFRVARAPQLINTRASCQGDGHEYMHLIIIAL